MLSYTFSIVFTVYFIALLETSGTGFICNEEKSIWIAIKTKTSLIHSPSFRDLEFDMGIMIFDLGFSNES